MPSLTAEYLDSIRRVVKSDLLPELQTSMARHRAELIDMVLSRIMVMEAGLPGLLRDHWAALAGRMDSMIPALPADHAVAVELRGLAVRAQRPPDEDALVEKWDRDLASGIREALQLLERDSGCTVEQRNDFVSALSSAEDQFRGRYEEQVAAVPAGDKENVTEETGIPVTAESLSAYLARRFPDRAGIRADKVVNIPGGRSKSTIMFEIVSDDQATRQAVMRKDFPVNFLETRVEEEFPLLDILAGLKAPVARPLWVESDIGHFGTPFMVSEKVAGKTAGTLFTVAEASEAAGLELARVLAFFHSLDLAATGIAGQVQFGDSSTAVHDLVDFWYRRLMAVDQEPSVVLEAAFTWLRDNESGASRVKSLVHGDAGIHNMMIDGDHVTALVDWEFAHAGDAAEDLAYCRPFVRQFMDWDRFLDHYLAAGGPEVSAAQLEYWGVWSAVRNAVATRLAQGAFVSGQDRDLRVAAIGMNTYPRLLRNLAAALKAED